MATAKKSSAKKVSTKRASAKQATAEAVPAKQAQSKQTAPAKPSAGKVSGKSPVAKTPTTKTASKRTLVEPHAGDKRYVRRDGDGQFNESDDVSRSLSQDVRKRAKTVSKPGQGDKGDMKKTAKKAR
jgi:hypothetical protein